MLLFSAACIQPDDKDGSTLLEPGTSGTSVTSASDTVPECEDPGRSVCSNDSSLVRGEVRLAPGLEADGTAGDLVVALTHEELGRGDQGGYFHTEVTLDGVDLVEAHEVFEIDMCAGGEMWTSTYGDYNLIAFLDLDGDNERNGTVPEEGEPATRIPGLGLEDGMDPACLDVVLDCVDGADCVTF